LVEGKGEVKKD